MSVPIKNQLLEVYSDKSKLLRALTAATQAGATELIQHVFQYYVRETQIPEAATTVFCNAVTSQQPRVFEYIFRKYANNLQISPDVLTLGFLQQLIKLNTSDSVSVFKLINPILVSITQSSTGLSRQLLHEAISQNNLALVQHLVLETKLLLDLQFNNYVTIQYATVTAHSNIVEWLVSILPSDHTFRLDRDSALLHIVIGRWKATEEHLHILQFIVEKTLIPVDYAYLTQSSKTFTIRLAQRIQSTTLSISKAELYSDTQVSNYLSALIQLHNYLGDLSLDRLRQVITKSFEKQTLHDYIILELAKLPKTTLTKQSSSAQGCYQLIEYTQLKQIYELKSVPTYANLL